MALSTQPYKGTRDFYPEDMRFRNWMFGRLKEVVARFGYGQYDGPLLEPFELYAAKTGEEIVNQQLYWMMDRGERKVAVRPEMTPTLARLVAAKIFDLPRPIRLFSIPNLMRYERPQKGRLREHWQLNVDVLGGDALQADAEILTVAWDIVRAFGGERFMQIKVNNRRLMDHLFREVLGLDDARALRMSKLIDAKDKLDPAVFDAGLAEIQVTGELRAKLDSFFSSSLDEVAQKFPCDGARELKELMDLLRESGRGDAVVFEPTIMRGMDYYTGTVFEVYDTSPENRRAMFGGGRYDNLVGLFGKQQLSGVGFGMGDVTLQIFLESHGLVPTFESGVDVLVGAPSRERLVDCQKIAAELRDAGLAVATPLTIEGFGAHLKAANRLGARYAVLIGESEFARGELVLKDLVSGEQRSVPAKALVTELLAHKKA
jgi:histidyl-tRNA synthetase